MALVLRGLPSVGARRENFLEAGRTSWRDEVPFPGVGVPQETSWWLLGRVLGVQYTRTGDPALRDLLWLVRGGVRRDLALGHLLLESMLSKGVSDPTSVIVTF